MNSEFLRTYVMLAQLGSFTKTAQKMITVPSTISKQIKQLEEETGKTLVIRDKKALRLTEAGEVFLEYAQRILDAEEACMSKLQFTEESGGSVRIGAVASLFQNWLTGRLQALMREDPSFRCSVFMDHSQILLNMLYDGAIDLCVGYRSFREHNCACLPFVRDEMLLVTDEANRAFVRGISTEELKAQPLYLEKLLLVADQALYDELTSRDSNLVMSVSMGNLLPPYLKGGTGYGFALRCSVAEDLASGALREIPLTDRGPLFLQSYLVYKKANPRVTPALLEKLRIPAEA